MLMPCAKNSATRIFISCFSYYSLTEVFLHRF